MLTEAFILSHVSAESHVKKSINKDIHGSETPLHAVSNPRPKLNSVQVNNYCAVIIQRTAPTRLERTKNNGKSSVVARRPSIVTCVESSNHHIQNETSTKVIHFLHFV